jgi:predicted CXXCH cytochrome family protein
MQGDKSCTGCHRPHASLAPKLLVRASEALCATCHAARAAAFQTAEYSHPVQEKGPASCAINRTQTASGPGAPAGEVYQLYSRST